LSLSGLGGPAVDAGLGEPIGQVSIDRYGNALVADSGANEVLVIAARTGSYYGQAMTTGNIYTVAGNGTAGYGGDGGPATSAELNNPTTVAPDGPGDLLIADYLNNRVRLVSG
jgi:hypothetical protein